MSLEPHQRTHLVEQLEPPQGWRLSALVGTTYGMDVQTLIALLLGLVGTDLRAASSSGRLSALAALQSLIQFSKRVRVAADATNIRPTPNLDPRVLTLLDDLIRDVRVSTGAFHPKLWVARFVPRNDQGGPGVLRILCASRNLSRSTTWELFAAVDAVETKRVQAGNLCTDTAAFLTQVFDDQSGPVSETLAALSRARPVLDGDSVHHARLHTQWSEAPPADQLRHCLPSKRHHTLVVSPFLRATFLEQVLDRTDRLTLISTQRELDGLPGRIATRITTPPHRVWAMRQGLVAGAEEDDETGLDADEASEVDELDLHAKLVIGTSPEGDVTLLGSANATRAAWFGHNVEAMMELRPGIPLSTFLRGFAVMEGPVDAPTNQLVLRPWLQPWVRRDVPDSEEEAEAQAAQQQLDEAIAALASLDLRASWEQGVFKIWSSDLDGEAHATFTRITETVAVNWWPSGDPSRRLGWVQLLEGVELPDLTLSQVGALIVADFQLTTPIRLAPTPSAQRVFRLEIDDTSWREERDSLIYREILSSADFERLLASLLTGTPAAGAPGGGGSEPNRGTRRLGSGGSGRVFGGVTLEQLLNACTKEPELVFDIDALVKAFANDPEYLGTTFREVWPAVLAALAPNRRGAKR